MQQYFRIKKKYPDAVLLFRVGDFYETFGEDAVRTSGVLGIVLTSRNNGGSDIELAGFPHHALDLYLPKLVKAGHRVAICEQLEKPSKHKKIVKRGVTEMVTPGITVDDKLLDHKRNNYLASVFEGPRDHYGIAFLDISTGEFLVSEGDLYQIDKWIQSFQPAEVILPKAFRKAFEAHFGRDLYIYPLDEWIYTYDFGREKLLDHFQVQTLKGFSIDDLAAAQIAAGACLHYLETTEHNNMQHIHHISRMTPADYMWMDKFTIRNLELLEPAFATGKALIDVLDKTISPMGSRLMRKWTLLPLMSLNGIRRRHDIVEYFIGHPDLIEEITGSIKMIGDLERLASKISLGKLTPREAVHLKHALEAVGTVQKCLEDTGETLFAPIAGSINPCPTLCHRIAKALQDDPPTSVSKGDVIRDGYHEALDDYRNTVRNSKELLVQIQQHEAERTGITSLKIGFNNVFGYYLEVTNKYKDRGLVPDNWVRKQTLTNSERYITEELKKLEQKILGAEERIHELEEELYAQLIEVIQDFIQPIQHNAVQIARIDCLIAFAEIAVKHKYCRPQMHDEYSLDIKNGRHPVIEQQLPLGESYVPNDTYIDCDVQQILLITGPNMSGKSALLRQTALIVIMAQMGSYVPASSATLGLVDKLFTRVGASDNISSGESTFMVEMHETASIMNNLTRRSLILLDEIGRGTSTYDGVSIAWSVAEYLHENTIAQPKTLFATHYHEMNALAGTHARIKNFHIATREAGNQVIFLRKLVPGGSEHSFGIHVAQMAGMPSWIVARAAEILKVLEEKRLDKDTDAQVKMPLEAVQPPSQHLQLSIFETVDPVAGKLREMLRNTDVNAMTPIDCMLRIVELKKLLDDA